MEAVGQQRPIGAIAAAERLERFEIFRVATVEEMDLAGRRGRHRQPVAVDRQPTGDGRP